MIKNVTFFYIKIVFLLNGCKDMTTPQTRHMSFSQNLLLNHRLYKNVKKIHTQHDQNHQLNPGLSVQYLIEQHQNGPFG